MTFTLFIRWLSSLIVSVNMRILSQQSWMSKKICWKEMWHDERNLFNERGRERQDAHQAVNYSISCCLSLQVFLSCLPCFLWFTILEVQRETRLTKLLVVEVIKFKFQLPQGWIRVVCLKMINIWRLDHYSTCRESIKKKACLITDSSHSNIC